MGFCGKRVESADLGWMRPGKLHYLCLLGMRKCWIEDKKSSKYQKDRKEDYRSLSDCRVLGRIEGKLMIFDFEKYWIIMVAFNHLGIILMISNIKL
jgi:hypothetical protein